MLAKSPTRARLHRTQAGRKTCRLPLIGLLGLALAASAARAQCSDYASSLRWVFGQSFWYFYPGSYSQGTGAVAQSGAKVLALDEQAGLVAFEETSPGHLTQRGSISLEATDLDVTGSRAYLAVDQSGVTVVNITNLQSMTTVTTVPVNGAWRLDVEGSYAYVVASGEITILRLTEPGVAVIGHLAGEALNVVVRGARAYVITPTGLRIANVSNPAAPYYASTVFAAPYLRDLALQGNYLQLTDGSFGLRTFDLANPDSPVLLASLAVPDADCVVAGSTQVLVGNWGGMTYVDTVDPASPVARGRYRGLPVQGGVISQGFVHLASGFYGVQTLSLGNGDSPVALTSLPAGARGRDLAMTGNTLALLQTGVLQTLDVTNPGSPVPLGTLPLTSGSSMAVQGAYAYVLDAGSLKVVSLAAPATPAVVGTLAGVSGIRVLVAGGRAYALTDNLGLQIIDVSTPASPSLLGTTYLWGGGEMGPVAALLGTSLYVGDNFEGTGYLNRWDVSDPSNVQLADQTLVWDRISGLAVAFGRIVLTTQRTIRAIDPENLSSFQSLWHHSFDGLVAVGSEGRLYTLNGRGGYCAFSYDGALRYVGSGSLPGDTYSSPGIAEVGGYLYATDSSFLHVFAPPCGAADAPVVSDGPSFDHLACAPNPFGAEVRLAFTLSESTLADLTIFDATGRAVRTLLDAGTQSAGRQVIAWDGRDDHGRAVGNGVYFARLATPARQWKMRIERVR